MMKTSEFIRNAVDNYLTATPSYACLRDESKLKIGLCSVLAQEYRRNRSNGLHLSKSYRLLHEIMLDAGVRSWLFSVLESCRIDRAEYIQTTRFMLAEFMALYFEDQGD